MGLGLEEALDDATPRSLSCLRRLDAVTIPVAVILELHGSFRGNPAIVTQGKLYCRVSIQLVILAIAIGLAVTGKAQSVAPLLPPRQQLDKERASACVRCPVLVRVRIKGRRR